MYKAKLWDEDKWNIHSSSYNSSKYESIFSDNKKEDKEYHEQKYGSREKGTSDYIRKNEDKEKGENKPFDIFNKLEEEKEEQEIKEEDEVPFKAAKQLFSEKNYETKKAERKEDIKTIEDAIKKVIEEEKNVIIMSR